MGQKKNKKSNPKDKKKIAKSKPVSKLNKIVPDSWEIEESSEGKILTFYRLDKKLAEIPVTPEVLSEIMVKLSENIIVDENIADSWTYRSPIESDKPDYLTLLKDGKILGTLPVDKNDGTKLLSKLEHYKATVPFKKRFKSWRKNHKIMFFFSSIITLIIGGSMIWGLLSSFIKL